MNQTRTTTLDEDCADKDPTRKATKGQIRAPNSTISTRTPKVVCPETIPVSGFQI